ncbi:hypothetical protein RhiJN_08687 [Ceratobasidium sp. AG-Ba]|nr:hypothetical protein RhiJN_08687 [Ceratobasidium sp. AG-Ba]
MADYTVSQLSDFVEIQQCCAVEREDLLLTKAGEFLDASKKTPHVHNPTEDPKGIAKDAVGILQAFDDISGDLAATNDTALKAQWDNSYKKYQSNLEDTVKLAEQGANYIQKFYDEVVSRFSKNDVDWEKDKNLIADFVKANKGQEIIDKTAQASQKFTDLKNDTASFRDQYNAQAVKKGQAYNSELKRMDEDRRNLQSRIDKSDTQTTQVRGAMQRTAGPGFLMGWIVRGVMALLGVGTFNMASARLGVLEQEEQVKERTALDQRADTLAKKESELAQTRHAVSVLTDNISDISGRFDSLAKTWAVAHANFVELGELLQNIGQSASRASFMRRLDLIAKSTATLTADMRAYKDAVAPGGVLVKPVKKVRPPTYDISRMYGWSDRGGSAGEFNDTRADLHPTMSIADIFVASGWVVDGLQVVYRLKNGGSVRQVHGTNRAGSQIIVGPTEYVSAIWGRSGRADNGQPWMGDCIQQISFEITNSANGAKRTAGTALWIRPWSFYGRDD